MSIQQWYSKYSTYLRSRSSCRPLQALATLHPLADSHITTWMWSGCPLQYSMQCFNSGHTCDMVCECERKPATRVTRVTRESSQNVNCWLGDKSDVQSFSCPESRAVDFAFWKHHCQFVDDRSSSFSAADTFAEHEGHEGRLTSCAFQHGEMR